MNSGTLLRLILFGLSAIAGRVDASEPVLVGHVTKVHDGDTINVELASGPIRVRLDGVDAPELKMPAGEQSRAALVRLALGKEAELQVQTQDRYGRLVAVVLIGDVNVNARMVGEGQAWAYRQYLRRGTRYLCELEHQARTERRGLWKRPVWVYPPEWRKAKRTKVGVFGDYRLETSNSCIASSR